MSLTNLNNELTDFGATEQVPITLPDLVDFDVVNYCGLPLAIPKGFKWVAMDTNGDVYAYKRKPYKGLDDRSWFTNIKDKADQEDYPMHLNDLVSNQYVNSISKEQSDMSLIKVKKLPKFYP